MLILSRREGEALIIDNDVKIKILAIKGNQVSVGIEAPESVTIHREEIYKKIQQENTKPDS
jgi:carbon storage regulator